MSKQIYITDNNFIHVGQKNADLDPMASKREGKPVYTGPFPYASFDKPPEYNQDEYAILVNEKWEIKKRLAGIYWHKKTLERLEVVDPYDGDLSDYTRAEPPAHMPGDRLTLKKDGAWHVQYGEEGLKRYRLFIRDKINKNCESLILAGYSRDRQRNIDREALPLVGAVLTGTELSAEQKKYLQEHREMRDYINGHRRSARSQKEYINRASQEELEELEVELNGK
jgi:hypothetical protein